MKASSASRHRHAHREHASTDAELFRRWRDHGDTAAREQLVVDHLSLARKLAGRYKRTQEPFEDLLQVASLGLLKAIDGFDPDRGIAFSSYAVPTILGELKRHFRDKGWALHLTRGLQELIQRIQNAEAKLGSSSCRSPTITEIANYLDIPEEQVIDGLEARIAQRAESMDQPIGGGDDEPNATAHETVGTIDEGYALAETSNSLASAIKRLRRSDREVLALRLRGDLTQKEIGEQIGVSQMQVSRILRRVKDELHECIEGPSAPTPLIPSAPGASSISAKAA
jgi:RNA polymerase sigma-B factor